MVVLEVVCILTALAIAMLALLPKFIFPILIVDVFAPLVIAIPEQLMIPILVRATALLLALLPMKSEMPDAFVIVL